jgi:hypothetical protein
LLRRPWLPTRSGVCVRRRGRERFERGRRAGCSGLLHRLDDAWVQGGEWSQREGATRRTGAERVGHCCSSEFSNFQYHLKRTTETPFFHRSQLPN